MTDEKRVQPKAAAKLRNICHYKFGKLPSFHRSISARFI